jgi:uncharacterized protein (TIGR00251 family)
VSALRVTVVEGGVRFGIRVQPRSSRPGVGGVHGDALKVRVGAPPVDGAANEAVVAVLADALRVPRAAVRLVSGASSRSKVVEVAGVSPGRVEALATSPPLAIRSSG